MPLADGEASEYGATSNKKGRKRLMMITHTQALLVVENITMSEVDEAVARFLDLFQMEPEHISIQGPAIAVGPHLVQRLDILAPAPVLAVRQDALQIQYLDERPWVKPAEKRWERLTLEHHLSPVADKSPLPAPLDEKTRALVQSLLDEVAIGSEYVHSVTQTHSDEAGVRSVLLFYEGRRTATVVIGGSSPVEHERAQQNWEVEDGEEDEPA